MLISGLYTAAVLQNFGEIRAKQKKVKELTLKQNIIIIDGEIKHEIKEREKKDASL